MAFLPGATTAAFGFQDGFQTTLSAAVTATDQLAISLTNLPTPDEGTLVINPGTDSEEEIYYTSKGTGVVNCPDAATGRGVNGTATTHNAGAVVKMLWTKATADALKYGGAMQTGTSTIGVRAAAMRLEPWTAWVPTFGGFGAAPTVDVARYFRYGQLVFCVLTTSGGTSNATSFTFTLPVAAKSNASAAPATVYDGGVLQTAPGRVVLTAGSNTASVYKDSAAGAWTNTGTKNIVCSFFYEAA